jgi:AcrR family transcriptional regulator
MVSSTDSPSGPRRGGRPRDKGLRGRVLEVAIDLYAEHGWSGFNFETVSTTAQVGRPALYRRWPDRSALLIDAFLSTTPEVADADLGVLHDELLRVLTDYQEVMHGSRGRAGQRLYLDRAAIPEVVAAVHQRLMGRRFEVVSAAISRAVEREGKASAVPNRLVFSFLLGAVLLWNPDGTHGQPVDAEAVVTSVIELTGLTGA